jgi:hypothetical protein
MREYRAGITAGGADIIRDGSGGISPSALLAMFLAAHHPRSFGRHSAQRRTSAMVALERALRREEPEDEVGEIIDRILARSEAS